MHHGPLIRAATDKIYYNCYSETVAQFSIDIFKYNNMEVDGNGTYITPKTPAGPNPSSGLAIAPPHA